MFKTHHHYIINTQHILRKYFALTFLVFVCGCLFHLFFIFPQKKISHKFLLASSLSSNFHSTIRERMSGRSTPTIPNLRVLVVDDDVLCLKIVTKMLQKCGYTGTFLVRIVLVFYVLRRSIFRKALIYKLRKKTATPVGELFETLTEKTRPLVRGGFKKVMKN